MSAEVEVGARRCQAVTDKEARGEVAEMPLECIFLEQLMMFICLGIVHVPSADWALEKQVMPP